MAKSDPFGWNINPSDYGWGGGSDTIFTPILGPKSKKKKQKEATLRQLMLMLEAKKRLDEGGHHSFSSRLKGIAKGALGPIGWTFDKIMRPSWAITAGTEAAIEGGDVGDVLHGMVRGFTGKEKLGFGEILKEHTGLSKRQAGLLGFPLDVITDPLMALSVAAAPVTGGGSVAAYAALRSAGRSVGEKALKRAAEEAGEKVLKGETDDILGQVLKDAGEKFQHRYAAWEMNKQLGELPGIRMLKTSQEESMTFAMARAEQKVYDDRFLSLRLGTRKHGVNILPKPMRIPVLYKPGDRVVERGIPVISQLFDLKGRYFDPALKGAGKDLNRRDLRILHEGEMTRLHAAEYNHKAMTDFMREHLKPYWKWDQARKLSVLDLFENPLKTTRGGTWKAVKKANEDSPYFYDLNQDYIKLLLKKGKISPEEVDFVKAFHHVTEELFKYDKSVGLRIDHFADQHPGRLYVPHVFSDTEQRLSMQGMTVEASYVKQRKDARSLAHLAWEMESGKMPKNISVLTDIEQALVHRSRSGAEQQANQALLNTLKSAIGIPTRIVDPKKVGNAEQRLATAQAAEAAAVRAAAHAEQAYTNALSDAQKRAVEWYKAAHRDTDKRIKIARDTHREKAIQKLEKSKSLPNRRLAEALRRSQKVAQLDANEVTVMAKKVVAGAKEKADKATAIFAKLGDKGVDELPNASSKIWKDMRGLSDDLDSALDDFQSVKRSDYQRGEDGADEFWADKDIAWDNVVQSLEDAATHLAEEGTEELVTRKGKVAAGKYVELLPKKEQAKLKNKSAAEKKNYVRDYFDKKWREEEKRLKKGRPKEEIEAIDKEIKRYKQGRFTTPEIDLLKAEKVQSAAAMVQALEHLAKPNTILARQVMGEHRGALMAARAALRQSKRELTAATKARNKAYHGTRNKEVNELVHEIMRSSRVADEYGNPIAFPKEYAARINRLERIIAGDPGEVQKLMTAMAKWMGAWKVWVTVINPGYRVRNTMTDVWNMWVAGVPTWAIGKYSIQGAKLMMRAKKGDPLALQEIKRISEQGIFAGLYAGDIQKAAKFVRGEDQVSFVDAPLSKFGPIRVLQTFNRNAENVGRLTHYLYRTRSLKEDAATAAFKVKEAHFDYSELTEFEEKLKLFLPFYTWTRKNIPYQVKQLFTHPGRYAAFPKFAQEMQFAAGNPDMPVSDWVEQGFGVPLPFGNNNYYMPQFGVSDLAVVNSPEGATDRLKSLLGPNIKIPAELMFGKQLYTGSDIVSPNHPRSPVSNWGADILSLIPGSNVGQTSRLGPGGKWISGPGASPWAVYALGQLPLSRSLFVSGPGSIYSKTSDVAMPTAWWSEFVGQSIVKQDPELLRIFENMDVTEEVDKQISGLRDAGLLPRKKRKKQRIDKVLQEIWMKQYSGGS